jgi:peptide chain release factor 1
MLSDPANLADQKRYRQLSKEFNGLSHLIAKFEEFEQLEETIAEDEQLAAGGDEDELAELARAELEELREKRQRLEDDLLLLLIPPDPNDERNTIIEIRAGVGGDEAALFCGDLFRMYSRYVEGKGWRTEILGSHPAQVGGFKEIVFLVEGRGAYRRFKYESGVHRVQRVPETESSGRIHTSSVTVAVLPEAEDIDLEIDPKELKIQVYRSTGPGGQGVNTTDSAVRITHVPSGMVVTCQDERSQHKNRAKAMKVLRARLFESRKEQQEAKIARARRSQVGTGDRSERIRTYNFPQGRVTDHRIGLTLYKLDSVLEGDIDEIVDSLAASDQRQMLEAEMAS